MKAKVLEFDQMNVRYDYETKEMTIDHSTGKIALSSRDIGDLKDALESIGQQTAEAERLRKSSSYGRH